MGMINKLYAELKAEQAQKQAIGKQNARYTGLNNRNRHNHHQRKQLDPIAFYSGFGISLKSGGSEWQLVKCAFHDDKKPSMSVNIKHGGYNCFAGCGKGSLIDFYMKYNNVDFKTACRELNI